MKLKNKIIKCLGGYTKNEYLYLERKYQALLDSKSTENMPQIVNEHIYRILKSLDSYSRQLYGVLPDIWIKKMYNVIHNNFLRLMVRYINTGSTSIYSFDITLDNEDEFKNVLKDNPNIQDFFILETD